MLTRCTNIGLQSLLKHGPLNLAIGVNQFELIVSRILLREFKCILRSYVAEN